MQTAKQIMSKPDPYPPSAWPMKAYQNLDFLKSDPARQIRVLCELIEPGPRLEAEQIEDTVVLFGSARTRPPEIAAADLDRVQNEIADPENPTPAEARRLHFAQCNVRAAPYYTAACELAERLTRWSMSLSNQDKHRFVVCSGGGPGIMEAANRGAFNAGGKSVGLGISLPFEQGVNHYIPHDLKFEFHYFFTRKYWFVHMAKALIAFPGGFGTLDELFETLTLIQTKKTPSVPPIVLFGSEYWKNVINFDTLVEWGTISPEDLDLIHFSDSVDDAFDFLVVELTNRYLQ